MPIDFFLSEMAVSNLHGGGLTLQRILKEDLDDILHFAYVSRFAYDVPPAIKFADRSLNLQSFWESNIIRKIIGNRLSTYITNYPVLIPINSNRAARILQSSLGNKHKELSALICPQSAHSLFTLEALKERQSVKYISWIMDDHLVKWIDNKWQYPNGIEEVFSKHLREAEHVFVISPVLQRFYQSRFKVNSTVLFGPSDFSENSKYITPTLNDHLKIGYFGGIGLWQLDALQAVANALGGTKTSLHIYSNVHKLPDELCLEGVYFEGKLKPTQVLSVAKKYNAVLLPISFKQNLRNMSEFNIATKMSECLVSGVPTLVIGPKYAAMIEYLNFHNAAIIVDTNNLDDITNAFDLLRNEEKVSEVLFNAEVVAKSELNTFSMRNRWEKVKEKLYKK